MDAMGPGRNSATMAVMSSTDWGFMATVTPVMPELDPVHLLEAALLTSSEPLSMPEMKRLFEDALSQKTIRGHLETLARFWSGRGLRLEERADGRWGFRTAESAAPAILRLREEKPARYSRAAMETLAVIAYHQPATREQVRGIRGVNSDGVISSLVDKGLVRELGRDAEHGQAILYGTTNAFLEKFGLRSLKDLPDLEQFAPDEQARQFIRERLSGRSIQSTLEETEEDLNEERELIDEVAEDDDDLMIVGNATDEEFDD